MEALLTLSIVPVTLTILSLSILRTELTRVWVPSLLFVHLGVVSWTLAPVLSGRQDVLTCAPGLACDQLGSLFVVLTIFVVACSTIQADCYFAAEEVHGASTITFRLRFFYACINLFLMSMTLVYFCDNLAYLWIAIEATTLSAAPLVYYDRSKSALEATWKFLIVCSVGIAFALLGTVFIFASSQRGAFPQGCLSVLELVSHAAELDFPLLRLGFFFCLIGYGTKAGIFPMHSWLPDAHSEAPAPASAMLSGALLNCALFGIWRVLQVVLAARPATIAPELVLVLGTITVAAASLFLVRQHNFKRMLAYSSIENVGLMLVAIGLGSGALFFLQAVNHSLIKAALFLLSGNITQAGQSKHLSKLHGVLRSCPAWGVLLVLATLAVTGAPPFGAFISETAILVAGADPRHWVMSLILIGSIGMTFVAVSAHVGKVVLGAPRPNFEVFRPLRTSIVPALLVGASLILGLFVHLE